MLKISVPIEPIPQPRPRFARGRVFQPARIVEYKRQIANVARAAVKQAAPMSGLLTCSIRLYRKYKIDSRRYGDVDNHLKAIFDALNGVVFVDDSQIVSVDCKKFTDKEKPRLELEIYESETRKILS